MILCGIQLIEIEFIQIENCFLQMYGNICGNKREKNIEKYTQILSCSGGEKLAGANTTSRTGNGGLGKSQCS